MIIAEGSVKRELAHFNVRRSGGDDARLAGFRLGKERLNKARTSVSVSHFLRERQLIFKRIGLGAPLNFFVVRISRALVRVVMTLTLFTHEGREQVRVQDVLVLLEDEPILAVQEVKDVVAAGRLHAKLIKAGTHACHAERVLRWQD